MGDISKILNSSIALPAISIATNSLSPTNPPVPAHHIDATVLRRIASIMEDQIGLNQIILSAIQTQINLRIVRYGRVSMLRKRLPTVGRLRLDGTMSNMLRQNVRLGAIRWNILRDES